MIVIGIRFIGRVRTSRQSLVMFGIDLPLILSFQRICAVKLILPELFGEFWLRLPVNDQRT